MILLHFLNNYFKLLQYEDFLEQKETITLLWLSFGRYGN